MPDFARLGRRLLKPSSVLEDVSSQSKIYYCLSCIIAFYHENLSYHFAIFYRTTSLSMFLFAIRESNLFSKNDSIHFICRNMKHLTTLIKSGSLFWNGTSKKSRFLCTFNGKQLEVVVSTLRVDRVASSGLGISRR